LGGTGAPVGVVAGPVVLDFLLVEEEAMGLVTVELEGTTGKREGEGPPPVRQRHKKSPKRSNKRRIRSVFRSLRFIVG
jgi:hypothetical protein